MPQTLQKAATRFTQTDRTGWVFTLTAKDLVDLLPIREPEQLSFFTETNRPITSAHVEDIEQFLANTPNWAMPSIILAVTPGKITEKGKTISVNTESLKILDGQHRTEAFSRLIRQWQTDAPREDTSDTQQKLDAILTQEMPAIIFEVNDDQDQGQLFAWFARNKPIESPVQDYFDESDPFGKAAKAAMNDSTSLKGQVSYEKNSLKRNERNFMTLNNLKGIATTMQLGIRRRPTAGDHEAYKDPATQAKLQARLIQFFDDFLPSCQPNYELLTRIADFKKDILFDRSNSYAMNSPIMRLIANTWAQGTNRNIEPERLAQIIGNLNMRRADPMNDLENKLGVIKDNHKPNPFHPFTGPEWEEATKTLITEAQEQNASGS